MTEYTERELEELLGAYALDAVDADEREAVEAFLATSPRARAEVAEHREIAALLAGTGAPAPDELWERIAGSLEEAPPQLRLALAPPADARSHGDEPTRAATGRRMVARRWMVSVTAVAAAIILVLGLVVLQQENRLGDVEDDLETALGDLENVDITAAAGLAATDPANATISLEGEDDAPVIAVLEPSGDGFLIAGDLEPLPADRTYQLWGLVGETPVSLGVLGNDPGTVAFRADADNIDALAISEEATGGAVTPSAPQFVGEI
jgi:anti-sigma-K factor RskA